MFDGSHFIEGEKVICYRIVSCPQCHNSQKIKDKIILDNSTASLANLANFRCPWCNTSFVLDVNLLHSPYQVECVE